LQVGSPLHFWKGHDTSQTWLVLRPIRTKGIIIRELAKTHTFSE
jgi:hypothetical protein